MSYKQETYKRLGDYIREVDVRNTDLKISKLVGLTINKTFIPSVANTIGTDLSKYKIIKQNQFACSLMQVSRDGKMPIAIYKGEDAIISPAYPIFEIKTDDLLADYLQMWFSRAEFDREAVFYAVGGVRGSLDWNDFMDMKLPIPTPKDQKRIVDQYHAILKRIETNKQTMIKLDETIQTIYLKMFIDDIDLENLPMGWKLESISSIIDSTIGGDWGKEVAEGNYIEQVTCIRGADINAMKSCDMTNAPVRYILTKNLKSRKLDSYDIVIEMSGGTPTQSTGRCSIAMPTTILSCKNPIICSNFCKTVRAKTNMGILLYATMEYLYSLGTFFKYENSSNGLQNLDFDSFCKEETMIIPDNETITTFNDRISKLLEHKLILGKENIILRKTLEQILMHL